MIDIQKVEKLFDAFLDYFEKEYQNDFYDDLCEIGDVEPQQTSLYMPCGKIHGITMKPKTKFLGIIVITPIGGVIKNLNFNFLAKEKI